MKPSVTILGFAMLLSVSRTVVAQPREVAFSSAAMSSNGQVAAVADDANCIHLFELRTGKCIRVLKSPVTHGPSRQTAVTLSADARWLGYADWNGQVAIWDLSTEGVSPIIFETASTRKVVDDWVVHVHTIVILPQSKSLLIAGNDGSLQCWDYTTKRLTRTISEGAKTPFRSGKFSYRMDGSEGEGTWRDSYGWASWALAVSPDRTMAATTNGTDSIRLWDVATGRAIRALHFEGSSISRVSSLSFSADGKKLAAVIGSQLGGSRSYHADHIAVWDVGEGRLMHEIPPTEKIGGRSYSWLHDAKFDVSGQRLLTAEFGHVDAWEISTGKQVASSQPFPQCREFFVHPEGELIIVVADRHLICENMKSGKEVWRREMFKESRGS